ncbi:ABC transporter permease [Streptomyces prunicolor]|uniref:ABC transporter permease n=1 Tax=Streptomyces prunicolor TaxID=67348 RepID=UPI00343EB746
MEAIAVPVVPYNPVSSFVDVLKSEFLKLSSVRSTFWTLLSAVVFNVGLGAAVGAFVPNHLDADDKKTLDAIRLSLGGLHLSQIAIGVLGVLVMTSEYSTGMIRATFSAVPQRRTVLVAKTVVFSVTAIVVGIVSCFGAYFAYEAALSDSSMSSSLGDPGVLRALIGGGFYLAVLGLLGLGLGLVIRASAGAIAALFGLLFVPGILIDLLPGAWKDTVGPYLPMDAGSQIFIASARGQSTLGPWGGFGVFSLYAAVALVIGFALINRRDA